MNIWASVVLSINLSNHSSLFIPSARYPWRDEAGYFPVPYATLSIKVEE